LIGLTVSIGMYAVTGPAILTPLKILSIGAPILFLGYISYLTITEIFSRVSHKS
jgi:hypothetical protein